MTCEDYYRIDPSYGTMEDLEELSRRGGKARNQADA